ncbi:MAG: lipopolysaccharide biosynthesis protein [Geminicoccaceae bacterium]
MSSGANGSEIARPEADAQPGAHGPRLSHVAGYGALRSFVEGLYGVRGVVLAGVLGAELFGLWTLARIVQQYLMFAWLGILRGLEVEISAASGRQDAAAGEALAFGRSAVAYTLIVFGALSLLAAAGAALAPDGSVQLVLGGLALGLLAEQLWFYVATFMRASGLLWRFAWYELAHATLHLLLAVTLAAALGLWGAFAGFLLAHLAGVAMAYRHAPLRPTWSRDHLEPLVRIGIPVSVSTLLYTGLVSVDRLMVGAFAGVEALGHYAFAVAVSGIGIVIGHVIRTVLFPEVFHLARRVGADASSDYLDHALLPIAWVLPPVFCLAALALGPVIELILPSYATAVPAARLFIFIGVVQGLAIVANLGVVARGRQRVLPWLTGGAFVANLLLSVGVLKLGLGLEWLAATALFCRTAYTLALVLAARNVTGWRRRQRIVLRLGAPVALCAALATLLGHVFPDPDLREMGLVLGLYILGVAPLMPGVMRGVRQARRLGRASA